MKHQSCYVNATLEVFGNRYVKLNVDRLPQGYTAITARDEMITRHVIFVRSKDESRTRQRRLAPIEIHRCHQFVEAELVRFQEQPRKAEPLGMDLPPRFQRRRLL